MTEAVQIALIAGLAAGIPALVANIITLTKVFFVDKKVDGRLSKLISENQLLRDEIVRNVLGVKTPTTRTQSTVPVTSTVDGVLTVSDTKEH